MAELSELTEDDSTDLSTVKHCMAQTLMFKAYRCFYLSESYMLMKKWPESIGLLSRAEEHLVQAIGVFQEWDKPEAGVCLKLMPNNRTSTIMCFSL